MWDFIVWVVCRESVKTQDKLKIKGVFVGSLRELSREVKSCAQHMTGMRKVMTNDDSWFSRVFRG